MLRTEIEGILAFFVKNAFPLMSDIWLAPAKIYVPPLKQKRARKGAKQKQIKFRGQ